MNRRGIYFVFGLLISVVYFGCGFSDLSRDMAKDMIMGSQYFKNYKSIVRLNSDFINTGLKYKILKKSGYFGSIALTKNGEKIFEKIEQLSFGPSGYFGKLKKELNVEVEVTGLADSNYAKIAKEAKFEWRYIDIPANIKKFITSGGKGFAYFKKYDNGWQLEEVKHEYNTNPQILTSEDISKNEEELKSIEIQIKRIKEERRLIEAKKRLQREKIAEQKRRERDKINNLKIESRKFNKIIKEIFIPKKDYYKPENITLYDSGIWHKAERFMQSSENKFCFVDIETIKSKLYIVDNLPLITIKIRGEFTEYKIRFSDIQKRDKFYQLLKKTVRKWKKRYPELKSPNFI